MNPEQNLMAVSGTSGCPINIILVVVMHDTLAATYNIGLTVLTVATGCNDQPAWATPLLEARDRMAMLPSIAKVELGMPSELAVIGAPSLEESLIFFVVAKGVVSIPGVPIVDLVMPGGLTKSRIVTCGLGTIGSCNPNDTKDQDRDNCSSVFQHLSYLSLLNESMNSAKIRKQACTRAERPVYPGLMFRVTRCLQRRVVEQIPVQRNAFDQRI